MSISGQVAGWLDWLQNNAISSPYPKEIRIWPSVPKCLQENKSFVYIFAASQQYQSVNFARQLVHTGSPITSE